MPIEKYFITAIHSPSKTIIKNNYGYKAGCIFYENELWCLGPDVASLLGMTNSVLFLLDKMRIHTV